MAVETYYPETVEEIKEFIENKKSEIYQLWIYDSSKIYLGSLLPNLKGLNLIYDNEQKSLMLLLYKNNDTESKFDEIIITISNTDLFNYDFYYL